MNPADLPEAWLEPDDGRRLLLRGNCRLGRGSENHIVIEGAKASRKHAAIHAQDDTEFWLIDLGSRNGTFLNGKRIMCPTRLRDGDRVIIAGVSFVFRQPGCVPGQATTRAGKATVMDFKDQHAWLLIADIERFTWLSRELPPEKVAVNVGCWIHESQHLLEKSGGRISKFLGDGFLACWESAGDASRAVADSLGAFHELRESGPVKFRVAVHYGLVTFGGAVRFGEESMISPDVNFVFRLENLASDLGVTFCASEPANAHLSAHLRTVQVEGAHEFKGFEGRHRSFANRSFPTARRPSATRLQQGARRAGWIRGYDPARRRTARIGDELRAACDDARVRGEDRRGDRVEREF
jgi:adenylate cyclase